jgi:hypothetical protein
MVYSGRVWAVSAKTVTSSFSLNAFCLTWKDTDPGRVRNRDLLRDGKHLERQ